MRVGRYFPYDYETLGIIKEIENLLGLVNKDCDKMTYAELIEYIDKIALMFLSKQI